MLVEQTFQRIYLKSGNLIRRIFYLGYEDYFDESDNKLTIITNTTAFILVLAMLSWIVFAIIYYPELNYNLIGFIATILGCVFIFYLNYRHQFLFAKSFFFIMYIASMIWQLILTGTEFSHHLLFIPAITLAVFIYKKDESHLKIAVCGICIIAFLYFELFYFQNQGMVSYNNTVKSAIRRMTMFTIFGSITSSVSYVAINSIRVEANLAIERKRSENLLLNILPKSIVNRLRADSKNIADSFSNVTILFADVVGFTRYASIMPPENLVAILNDLFTKFDDLAQKYGLEKIKTIGDCYMVASGLPEQNDRHAQIITKFALDMLDEVKNVTLFDGMPLMLRVGINSGPVVGGVIGKKKFIYDVWGDAVNIASRMESHGIPGQIHISDSTYDLIKGQFLALAGVPYSYAVARCYHLQQAAWA